MSWFTQNDGGGGGGTVADALKARGMDLYRDRSQGDPYSPLTGGEEAAVDQVLAMLDPTYWTRTDGFGAQNNNTAGKLLLAQRYAGKPAGSTSTSSAMSSSGSGSGSTLGNTFSYKPFTETFTAPEAPADLMDPWSGTYTRPTATDLTTDPGYQARLAAQQQAMERSAAAKGTLLTMGHQRALGEYGQEYASNEYQRLADRAMQEYMNAFGVFTTDKQRRSDEFGNTYSRKLGEYGTRFDIHNANQGMGFAVDRDAWDRTRTTKMDDFSILTGDRNFGLASSDLDLRRELGKGGLDLANRQFGHNVDQDLWGRNRSGYLDDYYIFNNEDTKWWDRNYKLGEFGKPTS